MSELLNDDTKMNELLELLSIYHTARVYIKNFDGIDNGKSIEIINNSDPTAKITCPERFQKNGSGIIIESDKLSIDLKIKCINKGRLEITIRALKTKDREGNIFPSYIDLKTLKINGKEYIEEGKLICYEDHLKIKRRVKDCELITIHTEWKPFSSSSLYETKSIAELEEEIEELKTNNTKQIEELKAKNQELEEEIEELKAKNQELEEEKSNSGIFSIKKRNK